MSPVPAIARSSSALHGCVRVPGDKSISHRALMLASQRLGGTHVHGLLEGEDVLATAGALRACGVDITRDDAGIWHVQGVGIGGLCEPSGLLDMGNAGTGARLMMGLLAAYPFVSVFCGDASLSKRPMQRIIAPLQHIGAQFMARAGDKLPLAMRGAAMPLPIEYRLPMASAQVKSAILLAGLNTPGITTVIEPEPTRDHTERMLTAMGVHVEVEDTTDGRYIRMHGQPQQHYSDQEMHVPADPSSAAFLLVAALLCPQSEVCVQNVCMNPLRIGLFTTLQEMGAQLEYTNERLVAGELVADITARTSSLHGVVVPASRAPSMIDEYPILAVAAAHAKGNSVFHGLHELRVKESDRLAAVAHGLHAAGVHAEILGDDLYITGTSGVITGGGVVPTHHDHRIAMSFLVMGLAATQPMQVDDTSAIATSFPDFLPLMRSLGADL